MPEHHHGSGPPNKWSILTFFLLISQFGAILSDVEYIVDMTSLFLVSKVTSCSRTENNPTLHCQE